MKQEFKAIIKQHENKNAAYIEIPFDVKEVFGAKRVKVKATFDGVIYRGSVVRMSDCYMIGLTKEIRSKLGKQFNEEVFVTLEKDEEERSIEVPDDFLKALNMSEKATNTYQALSYTAKKEYITWITSAKRKETRLDRIEKSILLLDEGKKLR